MNLLRKNRHLRSDDVRVVECFNLRPQRLSAGDVLGVVGVPQEIAAATWQPLALVGEQLLAYSGTTLALISTAGGTPQVVAELPAAPRCAHVSAAYVNVMTAAGLYLLKRNADGSLTDIGEKPDFGAIAITAEMVSAFESTVEACAIGDITAAVTGAYREIVESAQLAGAFVQPVVARCRLLDADGNVLHVTAPVAVMLPEGAQLAEPWLFGSDDGGATVRSQTITATAYRLRVTMGDTIPSAWRDIVKTLELQVTPQFHPIDFSGTADVTLGRATTTDKFVRVTLPGVERGLSSVRYLAAAELLKRAIERFDDIATTVAYISNPYANTSTQVKVAANIDVADESDKLAAALATSAPAHLSNVLARVLTPHTFLADAVANCADAVVWTNIVPVRFGGYSPGVYASTFENKLCSGYISVTFATGERIVASFTSNISPLTLNPLITYPSAEAVSMTMAFKVEGAAVMRTLTVDLAPDATGAFAHYVKEDLLPITLSTSAVTAPPEDVSANLAMPGYVGVTNAAAIPQMSALSSVANDVTAVIAARSGSSAWEYRRSRFYIFANDGIKLLTVNANCTECAVNLLDCRAIANRYCVADGGNVVYALSDGQLLQLSSNCVKCVARDIEGDRLAWISADNEVLIGNTDDSEAVHYCQDFDGGLYNSALVVRGPWLSTAGKAFAVTDAALVDLANRNIAAATDVRWMARCTVNKGKRMLPAAVRWMLKAEKFAGYLTVERLWLTSLAPKPQYISRLSVNGAIKSPIVCRLNGHRTIDMQLSVEASVSRDFSLTNAMMVCSK